MRETMGERLWRSWRELRRQRTALCDLLMGRILRKRADELLRLALISEEMGAPGDLDRAAHCEYIAMKTEQGLIRYGDRHNRCGYQAAEPDDE